MRSQAEIESAVENRSHWIAEIDNISCPSEQRDALAGLPVEQAAVDALKWVLEAGTEEVPDEQAVLPVHFLHHVQHVDGLTNCDFLLLLGYEIVASCRVEQWSLPGGWLTWVHVPEAHRRRGYATLLLGHVLHVAQLAGKEGLTLTVQAVNVTAQNLYRQMGFRACGVPYYDLGNIVMTHHFAPLGQKGGPANA